MCVILQAMYLPWVLVLFNMIIAGGYVTPFQTNFLINLKVVAVNIMVYYMS